MKNRRILIASIAVAAVAAVGGITAAASAGTSSPAASGSSTSAGGTVHTVQAPVNGKTETILVNSHGLPLYYYRPGRAELLRGHPRPGPGGRPGRQQRPRQPARRWLQLLR